MPEAAHAKLSESPYGSRCCAAAGREGCPQVGTSFDTLRGLKNPGGTSTVPEMHDQNDACADHGWIKGLGHSLVRMSQVHVYPRYHRRQRSDEIGIGGVAKSRLACTEV